MEKRPLDALRIRLVADVHRRVVEDLRGGQVLLAVLSGDPAWPTAWEALWIRDAAAHVTTPEEAAQALGGPCEVLVRSGDPTLDDPRPDVRRCIAVNSVATDKPVGMAPLPLQLLRERDPFALRLVLLRFPPAGQAALSAARLHRAEETLQRWRFKVAQWADMPSAPPRSQIVDAMLDALGDLDTPTVLTALHRLEVDPDTASGSKFETFAYLDRVLGLDLCHLVGKLRG
jgi:hypothetical protein